MAKKKRAYTKKNTAYWGNKSEGASIPNMMASSDSEGTGLLDAFTMGNSYAEMGKASTRSGSANSTSRKNAAAFDSDSRRFQALRSSGSPFLESGDGIAAKDAIFLCRVAYFNVAAFSNSVDVMSEFANTEFFLSGGTIKGRKFFDAWLKKVGIENFKQQYFREYFRGGNIFCYRIEGDLDVNGVKTLAEMSDSTSRATKIPVKYIMLDACNIVADNSLTFDGTSYSQVLSEFQVKKLKNPATEQDQLIYDSLPEKTKKDIRDGKFTSDGVFMQIDPSKVLMSFYKKQDYEAFAVPFGYRVLDDINAKLELKRMDAAIARSVENVILLVTMGESAKDGGAGVNQKNVDAVRSLFENESVGRVLVSDYTTEASFVIPDLKKVMGADKYEVLNQDIKDGLQNIIVGKENYSSTQMKAEMFLERLKEARASFINDIIQPEIKRLSKEVGFKKAPIFKFKDLDLTDENTMLRVVTRMIELSVLTPEQGMDIIHTGEFPQSKDLKKGHEEFFEDKRKGLYNPIVGGTPMWTNPDTGVQDVKMAKLNASLTPKSASTAPPTAKTGGGQKKPTGQKAKGRPSGTAENAKTAIASIDDFTTTVDSVLNLEKLIVKQAKKTFDVKRLSEQQKSACRSLCLGVVESVEQSEWVATASSCAKDPKNILKLTELEGVREVAEEHQLDTYPAALLYHSIKK